MGKSFLWAVKLLVREIRDCKQVVKDAIDTYRQAHGMEPLYVANPKDAPFEVAAENPIVGQGDWLNNWMLEELAVEQGVRLTPDLDLEKLARDRGWVDEQGKFVMVPQALGEMRVDNEVLLTVISEKVIPQ